MAASAFFDRVLETTTTTGTGTLTLAGAVTGYQSFAAIGNANTTPMAIWEVDANGNPSGAWEVANACTYTVSGTTLTRGTFLASSTGSAINFGAGTKRVAQVLPAASLSIFAGTSGYVEVSGDGSTQTSCTAGAFTKIAAAFATVNFNEQTWWDTTNKKFLPLVAGKYLIVVQCSLGNVTASSIIILSIYKTGAELKRLQRVDATVTGDAIGMNGCVIVDLNGSSDYIEVFIYNGDAVARNTEAVAAAISFEARYLGP